MRPLYAIWLSSIETVETTYEPRHFLKKHWKPARRLWGRTIPITRKTFKNWPRSAGERQPAQAEPLDHEALEIIKTTFGAHHGRYAASLDLLANLYWRQGDFEKAEPRLREAATIGLHYLQSMAAIESQRQQLATLH